MIENFGFHYPYLDYFNHLNHFLMKVWYGNFLASSEISLTLLVLLWQLLVQILG